jgi:LPXTG-motif cell wall-anchored protein
VALAMGIIAAVIMGLALPASAHSATITAQTECVDGAQVITWTIRNSSSGTYLPMTIVSTTVGIDGDDTPYSMVGYTTPVAQGASTTGTTTVPGGVSGTISATVHVSWSDGVTDSDYEAVELTGNCVETTTTTTVPETTTTTVPETTTTTVPETTTTDVGGTTTIFTTTTTAPETTTTLGEQGSTVPTVVDQATTTTAAPGPDTLPRTGSSSGFAVFFALSCLAGGALLLIRRRNWAQ